MNYKRSILYAFSAVILTGVAGVIYAHFHSVPVLAQTGTIVAHERSLIIFVLALSLVVVIPVFTMLIVFVLRYRADNQKTEKHHTPEWDHTHFSEAIWWIIPTAIIAIVGFVAVKSSHALDPYKPIGGSNPPLTIQVVALDWKWLFIYPDQNIATVNTLTIPEDTPIHFYLTADAPMNSFWIPGLGGMIMVMQGMTTQLNLLASTTGSFPGYSGNLSGDGFAGMTFATHSVSKTQFDDWVASSTRVNNPLSGSRYDALVAPSSYTKPVVYSPVAANLFNDVVMKYMMPDMTISSTTGLVEPVSGSNGTQQTMPMNSMPGMNMSASSMSMPQMEMSTSSMAMPMIPANATSTMQMNGMGDMSGMSGMKM